MAPRVEVPAISGPTESLVHPCAFTMERKPKEGLEANDLNDSSVPPLAVCCIFFIRVGCVFLLVYIRCLLKEYFENI